MAPDKDLVATTSQPLSGWAADATIFRSSVISTPSRRHRRDYNVVYSVVIIGDKVNGIVSIVTDAPADAPTRPARLDELVEAT